MMRSSSRPPVQQPATSMPPTPNPSAISTPTDRPLVNAQTVVDVPPATHLGRHAPLVLSSLFTAGGGSC